MTVSVDAALIKQALVNLLTVLADLAASGSTLAAAASTRVGESQDSSSRSAKNTSRDGLVTELSITVEGSGPPQTTLPAMLDPYTAEYSTVSQPGRSRLSLAVSKAIVTVHGGDINAVNSNGRYGFVVILPAR
jgi:K+-sensing histidine kinase KdpD